MKVQTSAAQRLPTPTSILSPPASTVPAFPKSPRHNLPIEPTALIGRKQDVAAVLALVQHRDVRLVTLTGPGGIGKTRLAFQVAADLLNMFVDGVYLVPLAPLRDPALVGTTIAQTLGVRETSEQTFLASLKAYLRGKHLLLLLDNFEHLLGAAPLVGELLAACPQIAVLATSRTSLRLRGEQLDLVPSLARPDFRHPLSLQRLSQYAAVRLLAVAEAWFDAAGLVADPTEREEHERHVAVARVQLDEETFNAAWAEGRALTLDQAVAEALGHDERGMS